MLLQIWSTALPFLQISRSFVFKLYCSKENSKSVGGFDGSSVEVRFSSTHVENGVQVARELHSHHNPPYFVVLVYCQILLFGFDNLLIYNCA